MIKFKTIKIFKPSQKVLRVINYTEPINLSITNGEIKVFDHTNVQTIIPIKYIVTYNDGKIVFNEYPNA